MRDSSTSPFIIIGMHRSGTAMIAQILENLGLFTGRKKQHNHEPLFFMNINDWLLHQSGASWDYPEPFHFLLENKQIRALATDYMRSMVRIPAVASFLGWRKCLRSRSLFNLNFSWGWKDPRNTYTLPLWLEIFPDARVIHIYRNGIDVANSLVMRDQRAFENKKSRYIARKAFYRVRPKRGGFTDSIRCTSLEGAFSLWEEYLKEAKKHVIALGSGALELKYEELVSSPYELLRQLADFCGLEVSDGDIQRVSVVVKKDRAYAYRENPELRTFAEEVGDRLNAQG
ncbi:MAG TPA: sulfotransferase [Nitrospirae bacterium]|nr:sulfotransferase [Nitrospirota bacterium]